MNLANINTKIFLHACKSCKDFWGKKQGPNYLVDCTALKRFVFRLKSGDESATESKTNFCGNHCNMIFRSICLKARANTQ